LYIKRGVCSPLDVVLAECRTRTRSISGSAELVEVRSDSKMRGIVEYWATGVKQYSSEYWTIVRNAFGFNGLGVPLQRAVVVGARVKARESSDSLYQYTFLWIVDPKAYGSLGVTCRYVVELRQAMCDLFRLHKVEIVMHDEDIEDMERSMRDACNEFANVEFVEEYLPTGDPKSKLDRKVHVRRKLDDASPAVALEESSEKASEKEEVQASPVERRVEVARYSPPESVDSFSDDDDVPEPSDDDD
jgi:hypothetical protein